MADLQSSTTPESPASPTTYVILLAQRRLVRATGQWSCPTTDLTRQTDRLFPLLQQALTSCAAASYRTSNTQWWCSRWIPATKINPDLRTQKPYQLQSLRLTYGLSAAVHLNQRLGQKHGSTRQSQCHLRSLAASPGSRKWLKRRPAAMLPPIFGVRCEVPVLEPHTKAPRRCIQSAIPCLCYLPTPFYPLLSHMTHASCFFHKMHKSQSIRIAHCPPTESKTAAEPVQRLLTRLHFHFGISRRTALFL